MKGLILKDLYNIAHNSKSMFFILFVFAFAFIPSSGVQSYIFMCAILCSMMIVTTFTFDDKSDWARYAMVMPISKGDLVAGKFIVMAVFSAAGAVLGLVIGSIGGIITKNITLTPASVCELLFMTLVALVFAIVFGSMSIPLVFRFGAEKGRILLLVSFFIPAALFVGAYKLLVMLGVVFTERLMLALLCCSPAVALAWSYVMYKISCGVFSKKEL